MTRTCRLLVVTGLLAAIAGSAGADVGLTYLGAFRAFPGSANIYGDMTFYPAGNGGAASLFVGNTITSGLRIYEIAIPPLKITSDVSTLNTAATLTSFPISQQALGLVWRSTDDKLYYSTGATGSGNMNFRSINRDGTGESANHPAPGWQVGGYGLTQIPDDWAAAHAASNNVLTLGPLRGPRMPSVDPWNASTSVTNVVEFNKEMTGFEYGDNYDSLAWVEVETEKSIIVGGYDKSASASTLWFFHVSDIEVATANNPPQPYKVVSIDNYMFAASHTVFGMSYDATNHILYTGDGAWNKPIVIHAWQCADVPPTDDPPTPITDLVASEPTLTSVKLAWNAPYDDRSIANKAATYDVRYSTAAITDANWDAATQATGEPVPSAPNAPETFVVTGLDPETTYFFAVRSSDLAGHVSLLSNVVSMMTLIPDRVAPAQVTDLAAVNVQSTQLLLRWTASGDDGMNGLATRYEIRYSTSSIDDSNFSSATLLSQNLTPKAPGQTETFLVTGLTPTTTYYFALKVADEVPNWSALSNVRTVTTQVPDVTAPAAVTDLTAGGTDPLSATLTWTASGDDGSIGTAASYEVRYSTSTIDDSNWAAATLVPNILAPQPAGSPETLTAMGLQPTTTYYFALKVKDEVGNTSGISNVATCTTASLGNLPVVTTVMINEKAGAATSNYPVTLSLVFRKGDVANNVTVRAGGLVLPTQTDVKVRWPGGSVRHALVCFVIPQLQANQSLAVEILAGGPNYNTGSVTKDQLLASDFEALMNIVVGSTSFSVSARQMLQNAATVEYWMQGGIATEFIIRDWGNNILNQLNVSYRVRVYPSAGAIRVSTVVDNSWINARGRIDYSLTLSLGKTVPQAVFSKTNFAQWQSSRWHKVFWQGTTPPRIEVRYNLPYMVKAGAVSNYDTSLVVPESTIAGQYATWNSSAHDIMGPAGLTVYFPTTGGRPEIGPYPQWASLYLCSMDHRLAEVVTNYGDISGSIPVHFRESDPARSFYRHPISIDDRPTIWTTQVDVDYIQQYIAPADRFPPTVGDVTVNNNGEWVVDLAHQPSLAYIPYLITGDLYYLEEMHFWACYDLGASNGSYRGGSQGWLIDQIRGNGWAFRNIVDAAAMTPDTMPEKAYLDAKIVNNINRWNTSYVLDTSWPTIRTYGAGSYTGDPTIDPANCSYASGIWQDEYLTWSFIHAYQMGYPTLDLAHWGSKGVIDRFTAWPGWNRFRAAVYAMPVRGKDAGGNSIPYATWAGVNSGFADKVGPTSFGGDGTNPNSYVYAARGVLALMSNLGSGPSAFSWANSQLPITTCSSDTRWAFAPQYKPGDITGDSKVNVFDLQRLGGAWATQFGAAGYDPACDLNGDHKVNVFDLQILGQNWNKP